MEGRIIPIPIELIINQFAQTTPGKKGPRKLQKEKQENSRIRQTTTKEREKGDNRTNYLRRRNEADKRGEDGNSFLGIGCLLVSSSL